jgi:glycosyltransferase involved in cell wall biosynthesis
MNKKIGVLLPFKDHFTYSKAGSASIWIKDFNRKSSHKKNIYVCGNTDNLKDLIEKKNYLNIKFSDSTFESKNKLYINEFIKLNSKHKFKLIEVHNRPSYVHSLIKEKISSKIVLIFHNNPLNLGGSQTIEERNILITKCEKLIFVSNWVKEKFFEGLSKKSNANCIVIYPSIETLKKLPVKKNLISFVGKLNRSKGFHLFGNVIVKILNKYKNWKGIVVGDEPREKYNFKHKNLKYVGWISHEKTLELYSLTSISVAPSFWEEPFGRTSMEAASRGCATIISKKGGLIETIPNALYLTDLTSKALFNKIEYLIKNKKERINLQKKSYQNVLHKLEANSKKIDDYRNEILNTINFPIIRKNNYKIIHISNFGNRLFNRLYFISIAKKISNALIRLGHDVLNISDRDIIRFNRNLSGKSGIDYLNKLFVETVQNYSPDLIILGHSDNLKTESLEKIKNLKKDIKIVQWFEDNLHESGPDPALNQKRLLKYDDFIDHNFITTDPSALKFIKNKKKYSYLPIPVDKNVEKLNIYQNNQTIYDLFFTMSHGVNRGVLKANKYDVRYPFIEKLLIKNPNILFDIYGYKTRQPIWSEDFYYTINLSKMGLNLSRTNSVKYYTSNRISSLIGNGLMTFIDIKTQLNDFFDDDEVVFYKNIDDLSEKLNYFRENDSSRKKIAENGQKKYFKFFNSGLIAKYIIHKIFGTKSKDKFYWEGK